MSVSRFVRITDSSNINNIDYEPYDQTMRVTFKSGITYTYHDVSASVFGEIISAESVGTTLSKLALKGYASQ